MLALQPHEKGRKGKTSPKNGHNNTKSFKKEYLCQHYYLATSPSWPSSTILFQYSHTEHSSVVSRTLRSKTSRGLGSKEKLFDLWSGSTKRSYNTKETGQPGVCSLLVPSTSTDTYPLWKPRAPSQKILLEYNQAWTQGKLELRGPYFLLDDPNFTLRALLRWKLPELCLPPRSDSKNNSEKKYT